MSSYTKWKYIEETHFGSGPLLQLFGPVQSFIGMFSLSTKTASSVENKIKPSSEMCFTFLASTLALFQPHFYPKFFLIMNKKKTDIQVL